MGGGAGQASRTYTYGLRSTKPEIRGPSRWATEPESSRLFHLATEAEISGSSRRANEAEILGPWRRSRVPPEIYSDDVQLSG